MDLTVTDDLNNCFTITVTYCLYLFICIIFILKTVFVLCKSNGIDVADTYVQVTGTTNLYAINIQIVKNNSY